MGEIDLDVHMQPVKHIPRKILVIYLSDVGPANRGSITDRGWTGSSTKKWFVIFWYCLLQAFVTLTTTTYVSAEFLVQETYGGTTQVVALGQSMFIIGTAVGPAFLGPLSYVPHPILLHRTTLLTLLSSDINGRKWVYVGAILVYAILNIGCAKALNLPMLIIFQFLCGAAGSVALCNVAGTIADLFGDSDGAGQPSKQLPDTKWISPGEERPPKPFHYSPQRPSCQTACSFGRARDAWWPAPPHIHIDIYGGYFVRCFDG